MQPSTDLAIEGLARAITRLADVDLETDELGAAIATGEALLWIASLDDVLGRTTDPPLAGLRYVRDRITHQSAVTGIVETTIIGTYGTAAYGTVAFGTAQERRVFRWRARDDMPAPDDRFRDPAKDAAYDAQVAGRDVLSILRAAEDILRRLIDRS